MQLQVHFNALFLKGISTLPRTKQLYIYLKDVFMTEGQLVTCLQL